MSEAMAIEQMAEDLASLRGYNTKTNVPYLKGDREQDSASDIDVLARSWNDEILAVECKSVGSPRNYENWNKQSRIDQLQDEVGDLADNIDRILDSEFEDDAEIDEVWFVFRGYFNTESSGSAHVVHQSKEDFQEELQSEFDVEVSLKPTHTLICELIEAVSEDMGDRRQRYASPTKELFRQLVAIADNQTSEIDRIHEKLLETANTADQQ
jgi:hypothetical protein